MINPTFNVFYGFVDQYRETSDLRLTKQVCEISLKVGQKSTGDDFRCDIIFDRVSVPYKILDFLKVSERWRRVCKCFCYRCLREILWFVSIVN